MKDEAASLILILKKMKPELHDEQIGREQKISDYVDSIAMMMFLNEIENKYKIKIEPQYITPSDFATFDKLSDLIKKIKNYKV